MEKGKSWIKLVTLSKNCSKKVSIVSAVVFVVVIIAA
jgi:hypothetical protein